MPTPRPAFAGSAMKPLSAVVTATHLVLPFATVSSIEPDWSSMMKRSSGTRVPVGDSAAHAHAPVRHGCPAHEMPHVPQCAESLLRSVSQPSAGFMLQSPFPESHWRPHEPTLHSAGAPAPP